MIKLKGKAAEPLIFLFVGLCFITVGITVIISYGKDIALSCQRSSDICVIEEKSMFKEAEIKETFKLRKLAGAEVIETKDSKGNYIYKVMLIINQKRISFSEYSTGSYKTHRQNVKQINNYVNSKEENFDFVQSGKGATIFGIIFAGIGALLLLKPLSGILKFGFKFATLLFVTIFKK